MKNNTKPPRKESSTENPVTYSSVYLRVQPFTQSFTLPQVEESTLTNPEGSYLQFILHLSDPGHKLSHTTVTQAVPAKWLKLWDQYDWVEDMVAESLRVAVEVLGQDYVVARMGWDKTEDEKTPLSAGEASS